TARVQKIARPRPVGAKSRGCLRKARGSWVTRPAQGRSYAARLKLGLMRARRSDRNVSALSPGRALREYTTYHASNFLGNAGLDFQLSRPRFTRGDRVANRSEIADLQNACLKISL